MPTLRELPRLLTPRVAREHLAGLHDRMRGLDFLGMVRPEEVGVDPDHANPCTPTGDRWLRYLLRRLPITGEDSILDVGCGKGSAMRVMLDFPFRRVDGVEVSAELAGIARANFARLRIDPDRCRVHTADAGRFEDLDRYTHVYLANPFSCSVAARFAASLAESVRRSPRPLSVVYNNPVCHQQIVGTGVFTKVADFPDGWGNGTAVYRAGSAGGPGG